MKGVYLDGELVHVVLQVLEAEVEVPRVVRRLQHATAPARAPDARARPQAVRPAVQGRGLLRASPPTAMAARRQVERVSGNKHNSPTRQIRGCRKYGSVNLEKGHTACPSAR